MGYSAIDILEKAVIIQDKQIELFEAIKKEHSDIKIITLLSNILIKKASNIKIYFNELQNNFIVDDMEEIDVLTYDKISFLINEFNIHTYNTNILTAKEFLDFADNLTKDIYSLFIDIQGRLVNNSNLELTNTYDILSKIISTFDDVITDIENTLI